MELDLNFFSYNEKYIIEKIKKMKIQNLLFEKKYLDR